MMSRVKLAGIWWDKEDGQGVEHWRMEPPEGAALYKAHIGGRMIDMSFLGWEDDSVYSHVTVNGHGLCTKHGTEQSAALEAFGEAQRLVSDAIIEISQARAEQIMEPESPREHIIRLLNQTDTKSVGEHIVRLLNEYLDADEGQE